MSGVQFRRSFTVGITIFFLSILSFALGGIANEASGRGAEFPWFQLGKERSKNITSFDIIRFGHLGWLTARKLNRVIGKTSSQGNNANRGWPLTIACLGICIGSGATGFYVTLLLTKKPPSIRE